MKKSGIVTIIGRPNVGKSTLLNNLLGHKVSITSPKPQTTRFNLQAVYEDPRGQIIFVDTPGIFGRAVDALAKQINRQAEESLNGQIDLVIYLVDHTRTRDYEENKALGLVRQAKCTKIMVINKIDIKTPTHIVQYKFMEEEFDRVVEISALERKNLPVLLDTIFELLPEKAKLIDAQSLSQPGLNLDSKTFVSELIREKAYLFLRREVPYSLTTIVDELIERDNGTLYVKARILTNNERYKGMIVGREGKMIREISMATRKELETATRKKVYVELTVEVDEHWKEYL